MPSMEHYNDRDYGNATDRTVVALLTDRAGAEAVLRDLKAAGFSDEQLGVAVRNPAEQKELLESSGTKPMEGAAAGAAGGGVLGGLIGLLAGTGALVIPGIGPIVAAGVLASTLAGAGIGAAAGGIVGGLVGMGMSEDQARHFDEGFRAGGVLVAVNAGSRTTQALQILEEHQADLGPDSRRGTRQVGALDDQDLADRSGSSMDLDDAASVATESTPSPGYGGRSDRRAYGGAERRSGNDPTYMGPERRLVGV